MKAPGVHEIEQGWLSAADGVRLCVYRLGSGKQAVVIPNAAYLLEHLAWLGREFSLVSYDPRQRGRSERVGERALLHRGVHHDAEDLAAVCRAFHLQRPHVVAHDYLAVAALLCAIAQPEALGRIVAIAPPPVGDLCTEHGADDTAIERLASLPEAAALRRLRAEGIDESDPRGYCRTWLRLMAHCWLVHPERIEALTHLCAFENEWPTRLEPHLRDNVRPSLERLTLRTDELALVRVPVLLLHGLHDLLCPPALARAWAARLPEARRMPVADAGHLPWIDAPGVVQPALEQFLAGAWPLGSEAVPRGETDA